jgi:WD40 repeat protein
VRLWELATGKEVRRFTGHEDSVWSVAVTPDGKYVVSGSGDKTVRLWDLATGKEVRRFTGHDGAVLSVAVTPDGKYVVSGSWDNTVRLWELATGKEVRRFTGHEDWVRSVAVTPDGQYVVSGSKGQHGAFVGAGDGARSAAVHGAPERGLERRGDARWQIRRFGKRRQHGAFVGAGDGARSAAVHGARDSVMSVAVTPDGKYVVSGSRDKTVRVWYIGDLK